MNKCDICHKNELNNYCTTNVCKECCVTGKCPIKYKCAAYPMIKVSKVLKHDKFLKEIQKPDAIVICMPIPTPEFPDNLQGECNDCGRPIYYRPYNEKATTKLCIDCGLKRTKKEKDLSKAKISEKAIEEIKDVIRRNK